MFMYAYYFVTASCINSTISVTDVIEVVKFKSELISFCAAIVSLIVLIKGLKLIAELRKKGVEALCGFHSRLKVHLKLLKRASNVTSSDDIPSEESVFILFCPDYERLIDGKKMYYNKRTHGKRISELSKQILALFENSDNQIPLSNSMRVDLDLLFEYLYDFAYSMEGYSKKIILKENINEQHRKFELLIDKIINEIDSMIPILLSELWEEIESVRIANQKKYPGQYP